MRLELRGVPPDDEGRPAFRVLLLNDGYSPVEVYRNRLIGPTVERAGGMRGPASVESTFGKPEESLLLAPFAFYGRDRFVDILEADDYVITAEYRHGDETLTASLPVRGPIGRRKGEAR